MRLADGTDANYVEINWEFQSFELVSVGIFAYKNNKLVGAIAGGPKEIPIQYLAGMVTSLTFETQ